MQAIGYLYKRIERRPDWLKAPKVEDIYSLSGCISNNFADYVSYWRHNGFWLFDAPQIMEALATEHSISLDGLRLFYYEAHEQQFDDDARTWVAYVPEADPGVDVSVPETKTLEGFDVVSFSVETSPECSPLSCNALAVELTTNAHCLFGTFEEAKHAIETGRFEGAEPGPYRIVAVYTVD